MIDVMCLRQLYKRQEVTKIKWIYNHNNPADSMTKSKASGALKTVIDTNRINLDTIEWVERAELNKATRDKATKGKATMDQAKMGQAAMTTDWAETE